MTQQPAATSADPASSDNTRGTPSQTPGLSAPILDVSLAEEEEVGVDSDTEAGEVRPVTAKAPDGPSTAESMAAMAAMMKETSTTTCEIMRFLAEKRASDIPAAREEVEDEPIMIDEDYRLRDDGVTVIDMKLRHRLATPNVDPADYWNKNVSTRLSRPRLGNNIYIEHISQTQVSALTSCA